jgi:hypothetical protein
MMRGLLWFLTDPDSEEARLLRENFVFKIVPMLNPDGVINGNYRTSLAGCDLNRRWKTPNKTIHPEIWCTKKLVKDLHAERSLVLFCDLHGHSRKQNVFMYGCNRKDDPSYCRAFPFMLSKLNSYFSFESSRFGIQKCKEATARIALFKELRVVPCVYTMESSFAGLDISKDRGMHLTTDMLESLGRDMCRTLLIYEQIYVPPELRSMFKARVKPKNSKQFSEEPDDDNSTALDFKSLIMNELKENKKLLSLGDGNSSEGGSDSAPSEDNLPASDLLKQLPVADKTLKQKIKDEKGKRNLPKNQKVVKKPPSPKEEKSPLKREKIVREPPAPVVDKNIDPKTGKPKPEMKDAQSQTDRSDYQIIKAKLLKERQ